MTWDRAKAARALADVLEAAVPRASVFPAPPATFNPPAFVVQFPQTVTFAQPAFGVDVTTWSVLAAVGADQAAELDELLAEAKAAVLLDQTLGRATQVTRPTELRSWRLLNVAGAEVLAAELVLETRM